MRNLLNNTMPLVTRSVTLGLIVRHPAASLWFLPARVIRLPCEAYHLPLGDSHATKNDFRGGSASWTRAAMHTYLDHVGFQVISHAQALDLCTQI